MWEARHRRSVIYGHRSPHRQEVAVLVAVVIRLHTRHDGAPQHGWMAMYKGRYRVVGLRTIRRHRGVHRGLYMHAYIDGPSKLRVKVFLVACPNEEKKAASGQTKVPPHRRLGKIAGT